MILSDIYDFIDFALNRELFDIGGLQISFTWIIQLLVAGFVLIFITGRLKGFLRDKILFRLGIDQGNREIVATLVSYIFSILGAILILQALGISFGSLGLVAGGLGIGVGLGLQNITKNVISGFTILTEGHLKAGNFIEYNGLTGYIRSVSLRSTIVRTLDGGDIIIPNSDLVENQVLNWSYDTPTGRIHILVGVAYGSDPVLVTEVLLNSAYMEPEVLKDPPPKVVFHGFGESSLDFDLLVWIPDMEKSLFVRSSIRYIIEYNLRQQGIQIPFPQRDLWLRNPESLRLSSPMGSDFPISSSDGGIWPPPPVSASPSTSAAAPANASTAASGMIFLRDILLQVECFRAWNDLDILKLIEVGHRRILEANQILIQQGDPKCTLYIVLTGCLQAFQQGNSEPIETFQTGDFFGELPLMLGIPSPFTLNAQISTTLFAIDTSGFQKLLSHRPDLAEMIAQELAKEQHQLEHYQKKLQSLNLLDRSEASQDPTRWIRQRLQRFLTPS